MRVACAALFALVASELSRSVSAQCGTVGADPCYPFDTYPNVPPGAVNCGGSFALSCSACPMGNGELWCNGQCVWVMNDCREKASVWGLLYWALNWWKFWICWLPAYLLALLLWFLFAVIYKTKVVNNLPDKIQERPADSVGWKESKSLFDCFTDSNVLLYTTFCLPIVAAKNYDAGKVCGYWPSCCLLTFCLYSPLYVVGVILRTVMSSTLRRNMEYEYNFFLTCLLGLFCLPCEVGRESMEVDQELKVEIKCVNQVVITQAAPEDRTNEPESSWRVCSPA